MVALLYPHYDHILFRLIGTGREVQAYEEVPEAQIEGESTQRRARLEPPLQPHYKPLRLERAAVERLTIRKWLYKHRLVLGLMMIAAAGVMGFAVALGYIVHREGKLRHSLTVLKS